jgi:hypothetical protein
LQIAQPGDDDENQSKFNPSITNTYPNTHKDTSIHNIQDNEWNGIEQYSYYTNCRIKFDSAASQCMSGNPSRLTNQHDISLHPITIHGFNNTTSSPTTVGINSDNKKEYYVPSMPKDLVLLCAHQYAKDGAAILHKDGGVVLKLNDHELSELLQYIDKFDTTMNLKVHNQTYEVDTNIESYSTTASRYFNTKVNVSNTTERILTLLLTGLSFQDWYTHIKANTLGGIPKDVSIKSLNNFEHKYGRTPDLLRLAWPVKPRNQRGLMDPPTPILSVGERLEMDVLIPDFNEPHTPFDHNLSSSVDLNKLAKVKTYGGAIAAAVCVDCFSGYIHGKLLSTLKNSITYVKHFVDQYQIHNKQIKLVAADSGVISQSMFQVMTPDVEAYLQHKSIQVERSEPHNHSRGTAVAERTIRTIKELMNMAVTYALKNPNLHTTGFTPPHILKLWGELFMWAVTINNLKICGSTKTKSKHEVYFNKRPNIQDIRLLPIFSILLAYNDTNTNTYAYTNKPIYRVALYVGPSLKTPGAIRAAIINKETNRVYILTTSRFTAATDGGGLNIQPHINNHLPLFIKDTTNNNKDESDHQLNKNVTTNIINEYQDTVWTRKHGEVKVRRSQRVKDMQSKQSEQVMTALFADWTMHQSDECYYSFSEHQYIQISETFNPIDKDQIDEAYKAITQDTPRTFSEALQHPLWSEPARQELDKLLTIKAMVQVDQQVAKEAIKFHHADLLVLFPVYEVKMRDGKLVYKVRLVGDGRTHYHAGETYSATPTREELLIYLHIIATLHWSYAHIDENRAFLNADHRGEKQVYAKLREANTYYLILKALYGMKTAPKDYQIHVAERFKNLGYTRLTMCSCMYIKSIENKVCIVFAFVDDFIFAGNIKEYVESNIVEFRKVADTTEPIWNPTSILGIQLDRDESTATIKCTMSEKISEVAQRFNITTSINKIYTVPMPVSGYIYKDSEFDNLPIKKQTYLEPKQIKTYMAMVGALVWISGIRMDILFSVMYLSWFTKKPRQHHYDMATNVIKYLLTTKELPLILGGINTKTNEDHNIPSTSNDFTTQLIGYTDASLGTAPQGRSITGHLVKLNPNSGAIMAKSRKTNCVVTSSFEAELDGASSALKSLGRIKNILSELNINIHNHQSTLYSDNQAMIEFLKGNGVAKGVRHMELRMWYLRDKVKRGDTNIVHVPGTTIPADKLTKLGDKETHKQFVNHIMGLIMLGLSLDDFCASEVCINPSKNNSGNLSHS